MPKKTRAQLDQEVRQMTRPRLQSLTAAISPTTSRARVLVVEYDVSKLSPDEIANLEYAARAQAEGADGHPADEGGDAYPMVPVLRAYTKA